MTILSVRELRKSYPGFTLDKVSFTLEKGYIMGFIGRNGAGKTTTLKAMLGLVHPDGGEVELFSQPLAGNELDFRRRMGVVLGECPYPGKRLRDIADVTARFYPGWDEALFQQYLSRFGLDSRRKVRELSAGMKVKFSLALALSHGAELLILDEPTSGLDPVSRDELIGIFLDLVASGERSILFSTHIISDLEKCADYITYIRHGRLFASAEKEAFAEGYRAVSGGREELTEELRRCIIGLREHRFGFEGMLTAADAAMFPSVNTAPMGLEEIMVHLERED